MRLNLPSAGLQDYKSKSQRARVATETWAGENLYCPNCDSPRLQASPANTPAVDYCCPKCDSPFQLKAQSHTFASRIVDAAYTAMLRAIQENRAPNLVARILLVRGGVASNPGHVREQYARLQPLAAMEVEKRGWTLDVLNVVRLLGKSEFDLADVYASEKSLSRLHPDNRHIRDKIRQQLQVLRDLGFLHFLGGGKYRLH